MSYRPLRCISAAIATWAPWGAKVVGLALTSSSVACFVYDESLLGTGGQSASSTSSSSDGGAGAGPSTSTLGEGGAGASSGSVISTAAGTACSFATDCPGEDTECSARACTNGVCSVVAAPSGTVVAEQLKGDCATRECDGQGAFRDVPDTTDFVDDANECTVDACSGGVAVNTPKSAGSPCQSTRVCTAAGACVECIDGSACSSGVCEDSRCASAACTDDVKNQVETDVDCGGIDCAPCPNGKGCKSNSDCQSKSCKSGQCSVSCSDGLKNNGETDVDCGGPNCVDCAIGETCSVDGDCVGGDCSASKQCTCSGTHLVVSEVRTRGVNGPFDEFVELYNPTSVDLKLDTAWSLESRSLTALQYTVKWTGTAGGLTIPARGHFLIVGTKYSQSPVADAKLTDGVTDAGSIVLKRSGVVVDAVCYAFSSGGADKLKVASSGYVCEGEPVSNLPHNDGTSAASTSDASFDRLPGGSLGNCTDTGSNAVDFGPRAPAKPQNRFSPSTPP